MPHAGCLSQTRAPFLPFFPLTSTGTVDRQGLLGRRGRTQHRVLLPAAETSPEPGLFEGVTLRRPSPSLPLGGGGGGAGQRRDQEFPSRGQFQHWEGFGLLRHRTSRMGREQPAPGVSASIPPGRILITLRSSQP